MPAEYFEARERALLGERSDTLYAAPQETAARGVTVSALRTTPEGFAARADFPLRPSPFCKAAFVVEQPDFKPGRHPYHHAGVFYSQEPSASSAAPLLGVKPGMRVLDLCAAPGGKSSQLAAALQGQGLLVSNEYVAARAESLKSNLERMGVSNAVVLNETPARIAAALLEFFDRVLVDAPCSGEGMFRKHEEACSEWSPENVELCAKRQDSVLDEAAAMLKKGGRLSRCTKRLHRSITPISAPAAALRMILRTPLPMTTCGSPAVTRWKMPKHRTTPCLPSLLTLRTLTACWKCPMISCTAEWATAEPIFLMYRLR